MWTVLAAFAPFILASPAWAQGFTSNFVKPFEESGEGYAKSLDFGDLYQATAIVTGTDMRQRPQGLAQCLREVLVKVSGEPRLAKDPRVEELAQHPEPYMVAFDYRDIMAGQKPKDDQGTVDRPHALTARFEAAKIDKLLADLGEHAWRADRPTVVPVVSIRKITGKTYLLSNDNPDAADQRTSFMDRAHELGIGARVPSEADLKAWGAEPGGTPQIGQAARPDEAIVIGTLEFKESVPGWVGSWRLKWRDKDYVWSISATSYDEAFRDIVRGAVRIASGRGQPQ